MKFGKITQLKGKGFLINDIYFGYPDAKRPFTPSLGQVVKFRLGVPEKSGPYEGQQKAENVQIHDIGEAIIKSSLEIENYFIGDQMHFYLIADIKIEHDQESNQSDEPFNVCEIVEILSKDGEVIINEEEFESDDKLSINQLKKFYYLFLNIYNLQVPVKEKKISLLMLRANIEYSAKRLNIHRFSIIMCNRIDIVVKSQTDPVFLNNLEAFKRSFEALVAYYPTKK